MTLVFVALTPAGLATAERARAAMGGEVHAPAKLLAHAAVTIPPATSGSSAASTGTGEAESGRSPEPGEGPAAAHVIEDPHPLARASRPLPSWERKGPRRFTDTAAHLRALFAAGRPIVGICASGILIRTLAPLLSDKHDEPPVLAVSEDGAEIVPLLGGHRGANDLARQLAAALGGHAAITTAGDRRFGLALDAPPPGWTLGNPEDAKSVMAALLAGVSARMEGECDWLRGSSIPEAADGAVRLLATTHAAAGGERTLVFHPRRLAVGIGCERDTEPAEVVALLTKTLADAGLAAASVACVVSIDLKADEPAILAAAVHLGVPARFFSAAELEGEAHRLASPSEAVFREVGCHGVAEGAALAAAGPEGRLVVAKQKSARATCAIAEAPGIIETRRVGRARGRLAIIGIGPGATGWLTPEARALLEASDAAVGYSLYLDLVAPLIIEAERFDSALGSEEERVRKALALAADGRSVALVSSGDAGIYAMATLVFELLGCMYGGTSSPVPGEAESARYARSRVRVAGAELGIDHPHPLADASRPLPSRERKGTPLENDRTRIPQAASRIEIVVAPGISAMQAAAARAGAPLGHDFCAVSLSDLLTPWEAIESRIRAAAAGDFVIAFYNPVSQRRDWQLAAAKAILLKHRPPETPVVLARNLGREGESVTTVPLAELAVAAVDMLTLVLVGASTTRQVEAGGRTWTYTPRGYEKKRAAPPQGGRE